jgi:hypothetical protein
MFVKLYKFIKQKPGLFLLIFLLSIISISSVKPDLYMIGWDNYSSYFNLPTNLFRTFFATWREYRGLGVPSDSESTDIFRQVFYLLSSIFFSENLLDQIYYLLALWVGVLSMYGCAKYIFHDLFFSKNKIHYVFVDLFCTVASLFYLFNLNTLSIFYSPLIPFTNRFYSLPLTILLFYRYIHSNKKRDLIFLVVSVIVTSGSYITPTVIITTLIAFFIFFLFRLSVRKAVVYSLLFLLLNSFWFLPFLNYTTKKSSIIPLARTFIEINESTLNRQPEVFSFDKQAILYPSFFDMNFPSLNGKNFQIHPLLKEYEININKTVLQLFPFLYFLGIIIIFLRFKVNKKALWVPAWILIFLFLSSKEYGPMGFIYILLKRYIPYFEILFRISDTKFHAYISFAGSIAAAYALFSIIKIIKKMKIKYAVYALFISTSILYFWLFRSYFNGNLIGFFVYNEIPQAYFDIAKVVNSNPKRGRVLHLPFDSWHQYWRSYSWGYIGSAFYNFLLNKPYIDKTFEPASMENAYLHAKINNLLDSLYRSTEKNEKDKLAIRFSQLLYNVGIQYVLIDSSVSSKVYSRNIFYSSKQTTVKIQEAIRLLKDKGFVNKVGSYSIPLKEIYPYYKNMYPVNVTGFPDNMPSETSIDVYEVIEVKPVFTFAEAAKNIDPKLQNILETDVDSYNQNTVIQIEEKPYTIYPFMQQNHTVVNQPSLVNIHYPNSITQPIKYNIISNVNTKDSYLIDVYGKIENDKLNLDFFHRYYPDINGQQFKRFIGSIEIPFSINNNKNSTNTLASIDGYRVQFNNVFISLPQELTKKAMYIASFLSHSRTISTTLLQKEAEHVTDISSFQATNPTICYGPRKEGYEGSIQFLRESLGLQAYHGSFCANTSIVFPEVSNDVRYYVELEMQLQGESENVGSKAKENTAFSLVGKTIMQNGEKPVDAFVCIREGEMKNCSNTNQRFRLSNLIQTYRVGVRSYLSNQIPSRIDIGSLSIGDFAQKVYLKSITQYFYKEIKQEKFDFIPQYPHESVILKGPLTISFPKALSPYSYYYTNSDMYEVPLDDCNQGRRDFRFFKDALFSYSDNCSVFFAEQYQYAYEYPYLFTFEYWLGSGQQPLIVIGRNNDNYLQERISLYQGYPNLPGFKPFQDHLFLTQEKILKDIKEAQFLPGSRLIGPMSQQNTDSGEVVAHIFQNTANTGVVAVRSFDMIEYPLSWYGLSLVPERGNEENYKSSVSQINYRKILPSLWKIDNLSSGNELSNKELLIFNEGYDAQWKIYHSLFDVVFGKSVASSDRCNGFENCFEFIPDSTAYYIFYTPELLSLYGWIITISSMVLLIAIHTKKESKKTPS